MSAYANVGISPAPVQTPFAGVSGKPSTPWIAWARGVDLGLGQGYYMVPIVSISGTLTATPQPGQGRYQEIDMTGPTTIAAPSAGAGGLRGPLVIILKQDASGGRVATFNAAYKGVPSLTTGASTYAALTFVRRPDNFYMCIGSITGGTY